MTELTVHQPPSTGLAVAPEQSEFTPQQIDVLRHMGVENASPGDLAVFFHVVKRTGLDPFARQIHMVGRNTKDQRTNQWVTKYTIQTGIDGYRLIGRRAADRTRESISIGAPEWAHPDGTWRPVWSSKWGHPVAARVTIHRNGDPFTAVAMFDEYKQTKRDGELNSMWAQRPAGQIAKCAEALAWRMAFPQDLAGVYVEDEMQQADNERPAPAPAASGADRVRRALHPDPPAEDVHDAEVLQDDAAQGDAKLPTNPSITPDQLKKVGTLSTEAFGRNRDDAIEFVRGVVGRDIVSRSDLSKSEASDVIEALRTFLDPAMGGGDAA